jgi:hypothetical protein
MDLDLETIKTQLDSSDYYTKISMNILIVGTDPISTQHPDIRTFTGFCSVEIRENKIVVDYGQSNQSEEEEFTSITKAVSFIKNKFPL